MAMIRRLLLTKRGPPIPQCRVDEVSVRRHGLLILRLGTTRGSVVTAIPLLMNVGVYSFMPANGCLKSLHSSLPQMQLSP